MRALASITLLFASAIAACAQTVYYATFRGDNYAQKSWHSAPLAAFKDAPHDDVYDSYTVERRRDGTIVVQRDYSTPSGDWRFELTYEYGRDRRLRKLHSELITFAGISLSEARGGLTRCIRTFTVSSNGTLQKTYDRIVDEKTQRKVARQFYNPQIEHWMTLDDLPIPPKA
jgi:hypothetical protein